MRQWGMWLLLVGVAVGLLIAVELLGNEPPAGVSDPVRLTTRTPTVTRTVGWWTEVATWTPTPEYEVAITASVTPLTSGTPTPQLPTVVLPTLKPTWTRRP